MTAPGVGEPANDAARIAHALLNELGVVVTTAQIALSSQPDHRARGELQEIESAAKSAVALVRELAAALEAAGRGKDPVDS